ncbi:probable E3 ubiquitin-protein ligase HERC4 isoform X2 [Polyodon spathula]|uniref:probable E3 ubiquitin-protein ligase HERC4 isoform X2 n=1 Tax=Polyodon spathula TaxID=7913 RepID=UPI001B7E617E|nr:probable E3 ubiquitin-protein ligase HERC4 isoform X2 [Polyodon spathula]
MYCWGKASWTEFGITPKEYVINGENQYLNPFFSQKKIVRIACKCGIVALVKENGKGWVWMEDESGRQQKPQRKINGQLFTWGQNSNGQLGLRKGEPSKPSPQPLKSLSGIPLAQIAAGGDHSFAVSLSGAVFGWGRNHAGQLGLGDITNRYQPAHVRALEFKKTGFIACGEEHTSILTKDGLVYTFGAGCFGQLGHNSTRNEVRPRLVAELWGKQVSQIACGSYHTLAFISSSGKVYSFGRGEHGQLGNKKTINHIMPIPVKLPSEKRYSLVVDRIFAGESQSFVLCSEKQDSKASEIVIPLRPGKRIARIDNSLMNKWIARSDPKSKKITKTEIIMLFSSPACLNASFLSNNEHFSSANEIAGLNMSSVREMFKTLSEHGLLFQVATVVQKSLLPSLSKAQAVVEALRVFLILPELIGIFYTLDWSIADITASLALAIIRQKPRSRSLLKSLWMKLPATFFERVVQIHHDASNQFILKHSRLSPADNSKLHMTLYVLRLLYNVNTKAGEKIPRSKFYIQNIPLECVYSLLMYPCILDMKTKQDALHADCEKQSQRNQLFGFANHLHINRDTILRDTLLFLKQTNPSQYQFPLKVTFQNEPGEDVGGVQREFFSVITRELYKSAQEQFKLDEKSGLLWFISKNHSEVYHSVGVLCGMALYNRCVADFHFPLALFKKLLKEKPTLEDLKELSPTEGGNLQKILDEDEDCVEDLYLDFTIQEHELVPNGKDIPVTKYNRKRYVDEYLNFVFNTSVEKQFEDFKEGFSKGCPSTMWRLFLPNELMAVLYGSHIFDWAELEKNARYDGYEPTDQTIMNFWTVFYELNEEKKKHFLAFLTGSDRVSVGGLRTCRIIIKDYGYLNPDDFFPDPSTCFLVLNLPNYSSIDILREKLLQAITCHEGFGNL